jgi:hypothetical protein
MAARRERDDLQEFDNETPAREKTHPAGTLMLSPRRATRILLAIIGSLLLAHALGKVSAIYFGHDVVYGLVPLFDFNEEQNIPTFYSATAMLFAASLIAIIAAAQWRFRARDYLYWSLLFVIFLVLAFDELFQLHERLTRPTRATLGLSDSTYFAWTLPMGVLTIAIAALFLRFVLRLPSRIRNLFCLAGGMYVLGAIGMEVVGGTLDRNPRFLGRVLVNTLEELLEMVAIVVLIRAVLLYLDHLSVTLRFSEPPAGE